MSAARIGRGMYRDSVAPAASPKHVVSQSGSDLILQKPFHNSDVQAQMFFLRYALIS